MSNFHQKIKAKQIDTDDLGTYFLRKYTYSTTISATNWTLDSNSGLYIQIIEVDGIKSIDNPNIYPTKTGNAITDDPIINNWYNIERITTSNNSIAVYCITNELSVNIPITIICYR